MGLQRINALSNVRPRPRCSGGFESVRRPLTPSSARCAQAWNIYSAPGALLALWVTERYGLRKSLLCGYGSEVVCSLLAHAACVAPLEPQAAYALLYFSQVVGAVGQPLFLNNVTLFAGTWFPATERDAAVAVSLLCVAAGTVFISILAPAVVTTPEQVARVFAFQVPVWAAIFAAGLLFTTEEPAQPPSAAAAVLRAERRRAAADGGRDASGMTALRHAAAQAQQLCGSAGFMMLNFSSGILTGLVYLLGTVVGQARPSLWILAVANSCVRSRPRHPAAVHAVRRHRHRSRRCAGGAGGGVVHRRADIPADAAAEGAGRGARARDASRG